MILVNRERAADENSCEDGHIDDDEFPVSWMVVGPDLELCIEVQVQIHESCEGSGGMARWEGLERVVNLILVPRAPGTVVHDVFQAVANLLAALWRSRLADFKEVRAQTANEPFEEDLEDCGRDQAV